MKRTRLAHHLLTALGAMALGAVTVSAQASSHREAPFITTQPKVDATDFYLFRSYEPGREGYVTLIANYLPLQDPYGGPNYFRLDDQALYEIHVDNDGDAQEDITFRFRFDNAIQDLALNVGPADSQVRVPVPLSNIGALGPGRMDNGALNVVERYTLDVVRGDRRSGSSQSVMMADGSTTFLKPTDNIGNKSIPDYETYAGNHIYDVTIPGCGMMGRVFVGQRKDSFAVNLGEIFDLINTNPLGERDAEEDDLAHKNVTTLALEVPVDCLTAGSEPVIGAWTTASKRQARVLNPTPEFGAKGAAVDGGAWTQVSRLGMPLVNEVVIGLRDKDTFNASEPSGDGQFLDYVTHPTLPELVEILFADALGLEDVAPNVFPREDLIQAFLTGVPGLNQPAGVTASEMLRLNTAIDPVPANMQSNLGVLGGDTAGFPNGRRPGDDVVDIELRVAMGALLSEDVAPVGQAPITDGVLQDSSQFGTAFPYLNTPLPGSPSGAIE